MTYFIVAALYHKRGQLSIATGHWIRYNDMPSEVRAAMASGRSLWVLSTVVCISSWLGLGYVVWNTDPALTVNRLLFLALLFLALCTLLSALAHYLHFRFTSAKSYRSDVKRSFREGALAALFLTLCAWLRMGQALNWINALLLLSALALVEVFILLRSS
jgi:hypothetical protein